MKRLLILTIALALVGCSAPTHTIHGSITKKIIYQANMYTQDWYCLGDAFPVEQAIPITVTDGSGKIIATGTMQNLGDSFAGKCVVPFTISGVPETDFYRVQIGTHPALTYSLADMKASGWRMALQI